MDSVAEGQLAIGPAPYVKPIRVGKLVGIAVRRSQAETDAPAGVDRPAADLDIHGRLPTGKLNGRVVAKKLLNRAHHQVGAMAEPVHLVRGAEERQGAIPDEVRRRLMSGKEQERAVRRQLLV